MLTDDEHAQCYKVHGDGKLEPMARMVRIYCLLEIGASTMSLIYCHRRRKGVFVRMGTDGDEALAGGH